MTRRWLPSCHSKRPARTGPYHRAEITVTGQWGRIVPGTPLARAVIVEMECHIHLGRWLPFRAVQLHAPPDGYVWAARARLGPLRISGFDRFADDTGEMRWRLLGHVSVVNATGPDLDRSAAGRVALDAMLVPPLFSTRWPTGATVRASTRRPPSGPLVPARSRPNCASAGTVSCARLSCLAGEPQWPRVGGVPVRRHPHRRSRLRRDQTSSPDAGRMVLRYRSLGRRRVLPRSDHQG